MTQQILGIHVQSRSITALTPKCAPVREPEAHDIQFPGGRAACEEPGIAIVHPQLFKYDVSRLSGEELDGVDVDRISLSFNAGIFDCTVQGRFRRSLVPDFTNLRDGEMPVEPECDGIC